MVDGKRLGEKNPKWLQDDYVKFIRFGQRRIEQSGAGILAFITNNSYLDNPTFRGMRQQLMDTFTNIYLLDLHGNAKKKERAPDGSPDQNVFDIQQGVSIALFVKAGGQERPGHRASRRPVGVTRQQVQSPIRFGCVNDGMEENRAVIAQLYVQALEPRARGRVSALAKDHRDHAGQLGRCRHRARQADRSLVAALK